MAIKTLKVNEKLFEEGDQSRNAYLIQKGMIRVYKKKQDTTIEIETMRPGQILGELAFLDNQPRSASAEAIVESEVVEISNAILDETLDKTPEWLKILLKTITGRLRSATNKIKMLENSTSEYETDKWGNRSREFTFVTKSELMRFSTALLLCGTKYGDRSAADGIRFAVPTLERFASQVLQINESKVGYLVELFRGVNLLKPVQEATEKPMLIVTDLDFIDRLIWFVNEQNVTEASKQRELSQRGFLILSLMIKNLAQSKPATEGKMVVNISPILATQGKSIANPPLRMDELQELMDQKIVTGLNVVSGEEVNVEFIKDRLTFEFRIFWILTEIEKLNDKKRKVK